MAESEAKFHVSRTQTKRTGLDSESITIQAEVTLPTSADTGKHLTELDSIIQNSLQRATETHISEPHQNPTTPTGKVISGIRQLNVNQFITEFEKTAPAHASFVNNTLSVRVLKGLRLLSERAPLQSFLIPKVLEPMRIANEITYQVEVEDDRYLIGIIVELPSGLGEKTILRRVKRLLDPIRWTLLHISEDAT